jgi:kynureninase
MNLNNSPGFQPDEAFALQLDATDPLSHFRTWYHLPLDLNGNPAVYLVGNSLGPLPKTARAFVNQMIDQWQELGVRGHFTGNPAWIDYARQLSPLMAGILGAEPSEITFTGTLTANIHTLLETFYRPTGARIKIMAMRNDFPSDRYAIHSFLALHGLDHRKILLEITPRPGEHLMRDEDIIALLDKQGQEIALVTLPAVHFLTGQAFDMAGISHYARKNGAKVGFDLAHAAGNIPLQLHDWDVDFAAWCGYKYLSGGPGNGAGIYIHTRHATNPHLLHPAGWWGNDPNTRFEMRHAFEPILTANRLQVSNLPVLTLAPMLASLHIYHEAGLKNIWSKSGALTSYLYQLLDSIPDRRFEILTPREPRQRGCQLSLLLGQDAATTADELLGHGIYIDERPPNIIRVAPHPLYNSYHDVWIFSQVLSRLTSKQSQ